MTAHRLVSIRYLGGPWTAVCKCSYATERDRRVDAVAALDDHIAMYREIEVIKGYFRRVTEGES